MEAHIVIAEVLIKAKEMAEKLGGKVMLVDEAGYIGSSGRRREIVVEAFGDNAAVIAVVGERLKEMGWKKLKI